TRSKRDWSSDVCSSDLLANLTLLDNVVLPGRLARTASRSAVVARARDLMERTGVGELAQRDITQASGGQLQRVGICRALINSPQIVLDRKSTRLNSSHVSLSYAVV